MNIKQFITLFLGFSYIVCLATPHQDNSRTQNDVEAKRLLDKVSQSMQKINYFTAHFSLSVEDASRKDMGSKRGIFYSKSSKYKIIISPNQEIFSDGHTVYTYDKSTKEIQITNLDPTQNTLSPEKLFTNFYDKDFSYTLKGKTTIQKINVDEIELVPKNTKKSFLKVLLRLDMRRKIPVSATIFDKSGLKYTYLITKFDKISPIAEISFNPKKYPDAQIVDLR